MEYAARKSNAEGMSFGDHYCFRTVSRASARSRINGHHPDMGIPWSATSVLYFTVIVRTAPHCIRGALPADAEARRIYDAVLASQMEAIAAVRPGVTGRTGGSCRP